MKKNHIGYLIVFFTIIGCQTNVTYIDGQKKESINIQAENIKTTKKNKIEVELSIATLKNTKWIFDNYSSKISLKNVKVPTIIFSDIQSGAAIFAGETFVNLHQGKLKFNNNHKKFLSVNSYKITSLNSTNKKTAYHELRYRTDFKKINSIKIYRNRLVFGIEDSKNTMIFKKV